MPAAVTVLFVHQSAEMYGSDKVLLNIASGIQRSGRYRSIVVLPSDGPLKAALEQQGVTVVVGTVAKISRMAFSPRGMLRLMSELRKSVSELRALITQHSVRIVYSNTIAVLGGAVAARLSGVVHVWHVHELVARPWIMRSVFPKLVRQLSDRVIGISGMVSDWLCTAAPGIESKLDTIWNGLPDRPATGASAAGAFRAEVGASDANAPIVAFVGRFNRWKGQGVLVDAANILWERGCRDFRVVFVGSPPLGEPVHLEKLNRQIAVSPCADKFTVHDFVSDVWRVWDACDIAVVPSIEPEPFGLVAIEAMASGKPVVAAAHGGLLDIVEDRKSGLLVEPGNASALADALETLIVDAHLRRTLGEAGRTRQKAVFSIKSQIDAVTRCCDDALAQRGAS